MTRSTFNISVGSLLAVTVLGATFGQADTAIPAERKLDPDLVRLFTDFTGQDVKAWIFLTDKGYDDPAAEAVAVRKVAANYNPRATARRAARGSSEVLFDSSDLPVADQYVAELEKLGGEVRIRSRWLNAVSVTATRAEFEEMAKLSFVRQLQPVNRSTGIEVAAEPGGNLIASDFYGRSEEQLNLINLIELHDHGFRGEGIIIGILDTGFRTTHNAFNHPDNPLQIVAAWDFVDNDPVVGPQAGDDPSQHWHGTLILGTLAAYMPNALVGGAYEASYILAKTEDITDEYPQEEDFYVAGLEFIEQNGADVATSSLGYIDWYTQNDLDGETAVTTIAVNAATAKGVLCCTAAGNSGHDGNPNTSHLVAPADAFQVFTCGATEPTGEITRFSSDGPTADGRTKPEVLAQGSSVETVSPDNNFEYTFASGTSLSTPLIAGAVACLAQARPTWTVDEMRTRVMESGSWFKLNGTFDPNHVYGYGIIDAFAAVDALSLAPITPGIAGQLNTLTADGGTPGKRTYFLWGTQAGNAAIPGCAGSTVYIGNPKVAGKATADANGRVELQRLIPQTASGLSIRLQALEVSSCRISNLAEQVIQ